MKRAGKDEEVAKRGKAASTVAVAGPKRTRGEMAPAVESESDSDMGEFEDEFEDEFESEDEVVASDDEEDGEEEVEGDIAGLEDSAQARLGKVRFATAAEDEEAEEDGPQRTEAFVPGKHQLEEGEELVNDPSAYEMLHALSMEWPCLSFDILRDKLPDDRTSVRDAHHVLSPRSQLSSTR